MINPSDVSGGDVRRGGIFATLLIRMSLSIHWDMSNGAVMYWMHNVGLMELSEAMHSVFGRMAHAPEVAQVTDFMLVSNSPEGAFALPRYSCFPVLLPRVHLSS